MAKSKKRTNMINLEDAISQVLTEYGADVYRVLGVCTLEVVEEAVRKLQAGGSYNGGEDYNRDWTYQHEYTKRYKQGYIVFNADHYQLAHLLEKGHVIRDGTGRQVGEAGDFPHIKPVEEWAQKELPRKVEEMMS